MLRHRSLATLLVAIPLVATIALPVFANSAHTGKIHFPTTTYCVRDLGAPPDQPPSDAGNLVIFGMNYRNQIVGTHAVGGRSRAYLWEPERGFTILGTLPGHDFAEAHAINNAGVVIGSSGVFETGAGNSFIWDRRNGMRLLDASLGGDRNAATDINSRGEIVGSSTIDSDNFIDHAYFRACNGDVFDIGTFPNSSLSTVGLAVNDLGLVVGTESGGPSFRRPFSGTSTAGFDRSPISRKERHCCLTTSTSPERWSAGCPRPRVFRGFRRLAATVSCRTWGLRWQRHGHR